MIEWIAPNQNSVLPINSPFSRSYSKKIIWIKFPPIYQPSCTVPLNSCLVFPAFSGERGSRWSSRGRLGNAPQAPPAGALVSGVVPGGWPWAVEGAEDPVVVCSSPADPALDRPCRAWARENRWTAGWTVPCRAGQKPGASAELSRAPPRRPHSAIAGAPSPSPPLPQKA